MFQILSTKRYGNVEPQNAQQTIQNRIVWQFF